MSKRDTQGTGPGGRDSVRTRLSELRKSNRESEFVTTGPLLELILKDRRRPARGASSSVDSGPRTNLAGQRNTRRTFLVQFEILGDVDAAAQAAGCTAREVRHWRASDPMFSRDFALAAMNYVRALKARVQGLAENNDGALAQAARSVLTTEPQYVGPDGRLDVRAWRDVLEGFLRASGISGTAPALHASAAQFNLEFAI